MSKGNAEEFGKFIYIEPNNLNGDGIDNAIPHDYEDYSMAVNLEVRIPRRDACGSEDETKTLYFSSDNGTISFFGGSGGGDDKQGFLTTNYTDVSVKNVGEGNKECLGIKNIQISYDSWFFPMVVIDFVDVRGASLMMPQEEAVYKTELSNNKRDITQLNGGSFFKALFSFPQPLFKLTVKGFYGRPAVYNLAVLDFKSSFNSQSGNFECRVQFKGYMYGVYADIPMTYLSVAPYIGANDRTYNEFWKDFYYIDENGQPEAAMLTYPEFSRVITSGITNANKMVSETEAGRNFSKVQKKKNCIEDIRGIFNGIFNKFLKGKSAQGDRRISYFYLAENENDAKKFSDKKSTNTETFTYLLNRIVGYDKADFSENDAKELQKIVKEPLERGLEKICVLIKDGNTRQWTIEGGKFLNNKKEVVDIDKLYEIIPEVKENNVVVRNGLKTMLASSSKTKLILYGISFKQDFDEYLSELIVTYNKDENRFQIDLNRERLNQLRNIIGFIPSIQNMFNMAFAHMETFVNAYYKMLNNIRTQIENEERSPESLGISGTENSDLPNGTKQAPPFPLFVAERIENGMHIQKVVPPWEFSDENNNMEEVKFVDELISGSKLFTYKLKEANDILAGATTVESYPSPTVDNVVPLTLYDFNHTDTFNPYKAVAEINGNSEDKALQTIITFFLRAYYFYLIFDDLKNEKAEKYVGRLEAINFKKAVPQMTVELRRSLLKKFNGASGGAKAFDYLLKDKDGSKKVWDIFNSFGPVSSDTFFSKDSRDAGMRFTYEWLKKNDDYSEKFDILPIGEFNLNRIKEDIITGDYINSDKYITIKNGTMSEIKESGETSNKGSFKIYYDDGNYFSTIFQTIKNSDDEIPDIRDSMIKQVEKQTLNIITSEPYYMEKFTLKKIKKNGEEEDEPRNAGIFTDEGKLFYEFYNGNYRYFDFKEATSLEKKTDAVYGVVGDSTGIDGNMNDSLFTGSLKDFYYSQTSNEAKAYLYIMSIPLDINLFVDKDGLAQNGYSNGSTLLSMLLREGAFWWRYRETTRNEDPIKWDDNFKQPEEQYVPIRYIAKSLSNKIERRTLSLIPKNESVGSYVPQNVLDKRITTSRKEELIKLFLAWSKSSDNFGFERLRSLLESGNIKEAQNSLFDFLTKKVTIIDTCSRVDTKAGSRKIGYDKLRQSFNDFITELDKLYPDTTNDVESSDDNHVSVSMDESELANSNDIRFSTYLVLKNLYDKWFCGKDKETWWLPREKHYSEKSDFLNMHFIDSYFNEVGGKIICNPDHVVGLISQYMPTDKAAITEVSTEYNIKSLYEFLSLICEKCGMTLMSLPLMYGLNPNDKYLMEDMFDAVPFSKMKSALNDGQTYMCVYSYKPSEHLDLSGIGENEYAYVNDTFNIADTTGRKSNILPATIEDVASGGGLRIPAFGVTYAKQNQSYFKNIGVNMENPQVTEASIAMTQLIASKGGDGPRESAIYGQDLYRVYSNYSYTCNVDMMGNSQVMPLMYFQLNNIPMFRGAYMITKVTHNIAAGSMTTQFTGVRQNKNATPLAVGTYAMMDKDGNPVDMTGAYGGYYEGGPLNNYPVVPDGTFNCDIAISEMTTPHTFSYKKDNVWHTVKIENATLNKDSKHWCAQWVKFYSIPAGAKGLDKSVGNAWKMRSEGHLANAGFECIDVWLGTELKELGITDIGEARKKLVEWSKNGKPGGKKPERGDIMVMYHGSAGHVCMWNDKIEKWVSDFTQEGGPWCYLNEYPTQLYLYRWAGTRIINEIEKNINGQNIRFVVKRDSDGITQSKNEKRNRGKGGGGR